MDFIICVFIVIVISTLIVRFRKNPIGSLFNPLFYLLGLSTLYLLLPPLYINYILEVVKWNVSKNVIYESKLLSVYYILIFYIYYAVSTDSKYEINKFRPSTEVIKWSKSIFILLTIFLVFIIILYVPQIYAIKGDRGAAYYLYESTINSRFKFRQIMYCHLVAIFILTCTYKKLIYLIPCFGYFVVDFSHGGRTVSFMIFIFIYTIIVLIRHKTYFRYAIAIIIFMIISGLLQRSSSTALTWQLYMAGAEFSNTYLTTIFLLDHPDIQYNMGEYVIVSLSKIFPGGMVDKMLQFGEWYGEKLSGEIGIGYGLAGNLITEALVYGGKMFAIIQPLLIGGILFIVNQSKIKKYLGGILYTFILCITMQVIVRQYFWGFILYPLQILYFYCIWAYPAYKKRIFK